MTPAPWPPTRPPTRPAGGPRPLDVPARSGRRRHDPPRRDGDLGRAGRGGGAAGPLARGGGRRGRGPARAPGPAKQPAPRSVPPRELARRCGGRAGRPDDPGRGSGAAGHRRGRARPPRAAGAAGPAASMAGGSRARSDPRPRLRRGRGRGLCAAPRSSTLAPRITAIPGSSRPPPRWPRGASPARLPPVAAGPGDLAVMPYASAPTGRPGGCTRPHRTARTRIARGRAWTRTGLGGPSLVRLPPCRVAGMQTSIGGPVMAGDPMVVLTRRDRRLAATAIEPHRATRRRRIATMAVELVDDPERALRPVPRPRCSAAAARRRRRRSRTGRTPRPGSPPSRATAWRRRWPRPTSTPPTPPAEIPGRAGPRRRRTGDRSGAGRGAGRGRAGRDRDRRAAPRRGDAGRPRARRRAVPADRRHGAARRAGPLPPRRPASGA